MNHATIPREHTKGEAIRFSPLEAFVAWLTSFLRTIAGLKRRTVFPPNWKDHWEGLRELEWYRDQILAFSAKHGLSGGSLDDRTDFQLILDVPVDYGVCPQTPQAMNRRFIALGLFRLDPDKYIQRHIRRIARAAHAVLPPPVRSTGGGGMRVPHVHDGGRSREPALTTQARAPPTLRSMFENLSLVPQTLRA